MHDDPPTLGADLFSASAQRIVDYLNRTTPLKDWSVTRVAGGEQVHIHVSGDQLLHVGVRVDWADTPCHRMAQGAAPVVADTLADPDYADLELAQKVRAYAGVPLTDDTGEMFGVLCGFGTEPLASADEVDGELVALMGGLLSSQLVAARTADRGRRSVQIAEALAQTDALTGLTNRRGWDTLVEDAQMRIDAYGDLVAVAVLDLDGLKQVNDTLGHPAGDRLITTAARALESTAADGDRVARYGGDEFTIMANNVATTDLRRHFGAFVDALDAVGVEASMGFSATGPAVTTIADAFAVADRAMYADKTARAQTESAQTESSRTKSMESPA